MWVHLEDKKDRKWETREKKNWILFNVKRLRKNQTTSGNRDAVAWKIPWTEGPGRLQSMGSLRVGHDWATSFHFSLSWIGEGNGNPLQCSCLENPRDGGAWWAAYGVAQSRTQLKRLSSSSSSSQSPENFSWVIPTMESVSEESIKKHPSIWRKVSFHTWPGLENTGTRSQGYQKFPALSSPPSPFLICESWKLLIKGEKFSYRKK